MRKTKYTVKPTTQFRKDYKLALKRGLKITLLEDVVAALAMGEPFPNRPMPGQACNFKAFRALFA